MSSVSLPGIFCQPLSVPLFLLAVFCQPFEVGYFLLAIFPRAFWLLFLIFPPAILSATLCFFLFYFSFFCFFRFFLFSVFFLFFMKRQKTNSFRIQPISRFTANRLKTKINTPESVRKIRTVPFSLLCSIIDFPRPLFSIQKMLGICQILLFFLLQSGL